MLALLVAFGLWLVPALGWLEIEARWWQCTAGAGLLLLLVGTQLFLRRSSGVRILPGSPSNRHEHKSKRLR